MSDSPNNEQREQVQREQLLLTAYFDNELGHEERAQAQSILAENPESAQVLERWDENAKAIRELPRYSLDKGFAARVMSAIEKNVEGGESQSRIQSDHRQSSIDKDINGWRIGLGSIAALAAMLLLTLFVFPAMIDSTVAVNNPEPETENIGSIETVPEGSTNDVEPTVDAAPTVDVEQPNRQPIIGLRNSSLPGRPNGRPIEPITLEQYSGPFIQKVLWIENKTLSELETVLANHLIKVVDSDREGQDQIHFTPQSTEPIEAVYVVATAAKMKLAIAELSSETSSVRAFPLPIGIAAGGASASETAAIENGSAHQIKPLDLSKNGEEAAEIDNLDQWFGLTNPEDDSRITQFLLLVSAPNE